MNTSAKLFLSMLAIGCLPTAQAAEFEAYARVISATPQVEQINRPRQDRHTEYVQVEKQVAINNPNANPNNSNRSATGAIIGGVAGALLGNQIGGGTGRTAATAVGAIAGAITGDRIDNNNAHASNQGYTTTVTEQPVRRCKTVDHWETRNTGYTVTYEFHGNTYSTQMSHDPGKRMRVRVSVTPDVN